MKKYNVTGMSCAACVSRIEKAVNALENVESCSVSLLTNSLAVEGTVEDEKIFSAVEKAGYGISKKENEVFIEENSNTKDSVKNQSEVEFEKIEKTEIKILKKRLFSSITLLLILMYFSMGHSMLNLPLPAFFDSNYIAIALVEFILATLVMNINKKFFVNGFKTLIHKAPTMDTLVALGSGVSWIYSLAVLFLMTNPNLAQNESKNFMHNLYFESAAMIVTLITVGKLLEAISKGKTTTALKSLMKLAPKTALIEVSTNSSTTEEKEVPISKVKIDDIFIVKPGMQIPVDGIVIEGTSAINESALTGESLPVEKEVGSEVSSGTMNTSGFLKCKATRIGKDTTLSKIIQMVSDAASTKAPIAKIADKVSGIFVPTVITLAVLTTIVWLILGADFGSALSNGICVLVVSCPCALGLATPVAIMVGNGKGAKKGILFKNSKALENAGRTKIVALDKTGTITKGEPEVNDIVLVQSLKNETNNDILQIALNLESKSEHPLAKAIVKKAESISLSPEKIEDFEIITGKGLKGNKNIFGGNFDFISNNIELSDSEKNELESKCKNFSMEGKTPLIFAKIEEQNKLLGIITVSDVIKEDSAEAITELKSLGIKTVMLTGDNEIVAKKIANEVGMDEVIAGVLPDGKEKAIRELMKSGKTAMVGDGINDAPSLTSADTGIAIGAGTDVAIDAADIVLVKNSIMDAVSAIRLSRATLRNIKQNLFWAFFYNALLIPIAMGAYKKIGIEMTPMLGAAAMSLSSFCVVTNALRLNLVNISKKRKNEENSNQIKKELKMEKTIKVEGMMCPHCEKHVKEAIEKIEGVTEATASHEKGEVVVVLSKEVADSEFEKAITDAGYKVL